MRATTSLRDTVWTWPRRSPNTSESNTKFPSYQMGNMEPETQRRRYGMAWWESLFTGWVWTENNWALLILVHYKFVKPFDYSVYPVPDKKKVHHKLLDGKIMYSYELYLFIIFNIHAKTNSLYRLEDKQSNSKSDDKLYTGRIPKP